MRGMLYAIAHYCLFVTTPSVNSTENFILDYKYCFQFSYYDKLQW